MSTLIAPFINLLLLVSALVIALKDPLKSFVRQRHESVSETLAKVRKMLRDAQEQYDEFSAKLKAIDVEIAALHDQAKQDAQSICSRVVNEAQRARTTIVSDARINAENIFGDLKIQLRSDFARRVVDRVEVLVRDRLTGDDRAKLREEFSHQVEAVQ
jgi:F0F1-type ATP synthase membrane subunit b/b'